MLNVKRMQKRLLDWYDKHRRVMPWRARAGRKANPYHVWLSEIMLQQTTVTAVVPYFEKFIGRWPTVDDLAKADIDDVLAAWAGLGYYARARNLHKCAKAVAAAGGVFPEEEVGLQALPGIGPYTAAAIASIAFGRQAVAVDGNVERVVSRIFAIDAPSKQVYRTQAAMLARDNPRPGDFTQAFMELGATVCTPKNPKCGACPWRTDCAAFQRGESTAFPLRQEKKQKPLRRGCVFWMRRADGAFCIEKRADGGLYGGMYQLPTGTWRVGGAVLGTEEKQFIKKMKLKKYSIEVKHSFTHFDLVLEVWGGQVRAPTPVKGAVWIGADETEKFALPSLMKKVVRAAIGTESL